MPQTTEVYMEGARQKGMPQTADIYTKVNVKCGTSESTSHLQHFAQVVKLMFHLDKQTHINSGTQSIQRISHNFEVAAHRMIVLLSMHEDKQTHIKSESHVLQLAHHRAPSKVLLENVVCVFVQEGTCKQVRIDPSISPDKLIGKNERVHDTFTRYRANSPWKQKLATSRTSSYASAMNHHFAHMHLTIQCSQAQA